MVDALVLEASTSVCGFESHLPAPKEKRHRKVPFSFGAKVFGYAKCRPLRRGLPLRSMCGRNLRFPHTRPLPFCDTIQFAIETDRSCHRQRPGAEWCSGLFSCPKSALPFQPIRTFPDQRSHPGMPSFGLYHRLPQDSPSRTRAAERHSATLHSSLFSILSSLAPLWPSPPTSREGQRTAPRRVDICLFICNNSYTT